MANILKVGGGSGKFELYTTHLLQESTTTINVEKGKYILVLFSANNAWRDADVTTYTITSGTITQIKNERYDLSASDKSLFTRQIIFEINATENATITLQYFNNSTQRTRNYALFKI